MLADSNGPAERAVHLVHLERHPNVLEAANVRALADERHTRRRWPPSLHCGRDALVRLLEDERAVPAEGGDWRYGHARVIGSRGRQHESHTGAR